jgi:hypothetical protein
MRFSIRDLLWATLVVAMGLAWWRADAKRLEAVGQAHRLRAALVSAKESGEQGTPVRPIWTETRRGRFAVARYAAVDLSVLDEPLVEP